MKPLERLPSRFCLALTLLGVGIDDGGGVDVGIGVDWGSGGGADVGIELGCGVVDENDENRR